MGKSITKRKHKDDDDADTSSSSDEEVINQKKEERVLKKKKVVESSDSSDHSDNEKKDKKERKEKKEKREKKDKKDKKEKKEKKEKKKDSDSDDNDKDKKEKKESNDKKEDSDRDDKEKKSKKKQPEYKIGNSDKVDVKSITTKKPWLSLLKSFNNVIWSVDDDETPNIVIIYDEEECNSFCSILNDIYTQESSSNNNNNNNNKSTNNTTLSPYVSKYLNKKSSTSSTTTSRMVLGMDTEGTKVYTIQISTLTVCAIVCVARIGVIPKSLEEVLTSRSIVLCGVGVGQDFENIKQSFGVQCQSSLDASGVARNCGLTREYLSLDHISIDLLGKSKRTPPTGIPPAKLHDQRIQNISFLTYAAVDAWLGYKLAQALYNNLKKNDISFFDWSKANLTNFVFHDKEKEKDKDKQQLDDKDNLKKDNENNNIKETTTTTKIIEKKSNNNYNNNYNNNNYKSTSSNYNNNHKNSNRSEYRIQDNEKRNEEAHQHTYLNKLKQLQEGQRRPFI